MEFDFRGKKTSEAKMTFNASDPSAVDQRLENDKYVGLWLALASSLLIGTSFIITKKGLIDSQRNGDGIDNIMYLMAMPFSECYFYIKLCRLSQPFPAKVILI